MSRKNYFLTFKTTYQCRLNFYIKYYQILSIPGLKYIDYFRVPRLLIFFIRHSYLTPIRFSQLVRQVCVLSLLFQYIFPHLSLVFFNKSPLYLIVSYILPIIISSTGLVKIRLVKSIYNLIPFH